MQPMVFSISGKEYCGVSALEIVDALKREATERQESITPRQFMLDSLAQLRGRIPLLKIDAGLQFDDEMFALCYLYLRDEYGLGELSDVAYRHAVARPLNLT